MSDSNNIWCEMSNEELNTILKTLIRQGSKSPDVDEIMDELLSREEVEQE